eukprot:102651_1
MHPRRLLTFEEMWINAKEGPKSYLSDYDDVVSDDDTTSFTITISNQQFYILCAILIVLLITNILCLAYRNCKNCCKSNKTQYTKVRMVSTSDEDMTHLNPI